MLFRLHTLVGAVALLSVATFPAVGQIMPDSTLGNEGSLLRSDVEVRGDLADLVEGGATRGGNLFHSFFEFNVDDGQRVYFANPVGIGSILSRVTGENPSDIFGLLGVDGGADLFLLNPNGMVFGEGVTFDIEGSFYGTTGDAVGLGEDGVFSAVEPGSSRLLRVNPSVLLGNYLTADSGDIESRGQLAVLGDLVLAGNGLDLQGQVAAGGDLTLLGLDGVRIRDTAETPFVGFAGGDLLVQGDQQVDIVALSHPDSGLFSYGDMVLRSGSPVGGDAHYWSGGGFRVETLEGEAGALESPVDPIIRTVGDVSIGSYQGTSLHILAGGAVQIGSAIIIGAAVGNPDIDFIQETIQLSDGTSIQVDGSAQPTLDVRAGVLPDAIGLPSFNFLPSIVFAPVFTDTPSSANISIGTVFMNVPNGFVFLTNQYEPNLQLVEGNIQVSNAFSPIGIGAIFAGNPQSGLPGSGNITLDARDNIIVTDSAVTTLSLEDSGGEIVLLAEEDIRFNSIIGFPTGAFTGVPLSSDNKGGNIRLEANNLELNGGAQINTTTNGSGDAGNIVINVRENASFIGVNPLSAGVASGIQANANPGTTGNAGDVSVRVGGSLELKNGGQISNSTFGVGDSGTIDIEVTGDFILSGPNRSLIESDIGNFAEGDGGDINIKAATLLLQDGAFLSAEVFGQGDAGDINITTDGDIRVEGIGDPRSNTLILNRVSGGAMGDAGDVNIFSDGSFLMTNNAQISVSTEGMGDSGNVLIDVKENVYLENATIFTEVSDGERSGSEGGVGDSGDITIRARTLSLLEGSQLRLDTENEGNAGNAFILADESITIAGSGPGSGPNRDIIVASGISSTVERLAEGEGGDINVTTDQLNINDGFISSSTDGRGDAGSIIIEVDALNAIEGAQISANTSGIGDSGLVVINAEGKVIFQGRDSSDFPSAIFSLVNEGANGDSRGIIVNAGSLIIKDRAQIASATQGNGNAGNVVINVQENVSLDNSIVITEVTENLGEGTGGNIVIDASVLELADGSALLADTENLGDAGSIFIEVSERITLSGQGPDALVPNRIIPSQITTTVEEQAIGEGGDIDIATRTLEITDDAFLRTRSFGQGPAGDVNIRVESLQIFDGSVETNSTRSVGGNIGINALMSQPSGIVVLRGDSDITTDSLGDGGNITLNAVVVALDDSDILARSEDERGGNITFGPFFSQTLPIGAISPVENNGRVDISADGQLASGIITALDTSFVENSLNALSGEFVDTSTLTAGSCIVSTDDDNTGSFVVTGGEGLPQQPGTAPLAVYPTDDIQSPTASTAASDIQEAHGVYQLADGRLVLSHECERARSR